MYELRRHSKNHRNLEQVIGHMLFLDDGDVETIP